MIMEILHQFGFVGYLFQMKMKCIEDCCEILDSMRIPITATERKTGKYPYYGANGIQDYVEDYIFDDELVLLAEDGGNFGSKDKPIAYRVSGKCWVNNHAHVLKPQKDIDVDYLCYSLMFYDVKGIINGATRQKLTQAAMRKMQIPVRAMEEQLKIVEKLSKVIGIKEKRKQELKYLDDLIRARFVEMFGNPVLNDRGWKQVPLGVVTTKIGSGATPKGGKGAYQESGVTLIRSMNVHNGRFEYKELAHISDEQARKLDNVVMEEKDVLLNITGASVARSCIVPTEILPARVNQHVCIIRCKECIIPEFLNKLLIDDNYQKLLWSIAGSGATREAITKQQVEKLQIILPPVKLQNKYIEFCNQIDKSKVAVQKALDEAQLLFDSLMQEYFG